MTTHIHTTDLNVWYNGLHALKAVSTELPAQSITSLIGASGSGKSTYLRALNRMHDTVSIARVTGTIRIDNIDVLNQSTDVISLRRRVGMVFQNPTPFPKSIYDNIAYGLRIQGITKETHPLNWFRSQPINPLQLQASQHELDQTVVRSLKEAALWDEVKDRLHKSAFGLSGGQQQRLCIARSLAVRPDVLLLDEPCSELDPISTHKIEQLLLELKRHYTIVIVTHNMHQARRISDHVGFFHLGELVEFGTADEIFDRPKEKLTREYTRGEFG